MAKKKAKKIGEQEDGCEKDKTPHESQDSTATGESASSTATGAEDTTAEERILEEAQASVHVNAQTDSKKKESLEDKLCANRMHIVMWLTEINPQYAVYADALIETGFDDLVACQLLTEQDLRECNVKAGHARVIADCAMSSAAAAMSALQKAAPLAAAPAPPTSKPAPTLTPAPEAHTEPVTPKFSNSTPQQQELSVTMAEIMRLTEDYAESVGEQFASMPHMELGQYHETCLTVQLVSHRALARKMQQTTKQRYYFG